MRYHGGKWRIAPRIIELMPSHRRYVEPYGGGAGVLLRKSRHGIAGEIYNDLDGEVVNVFRVLRDPAQADRLRQLVELTPFSRAEFNLSYQTCDDPIEQARRTIFRSFGAYGTTHRRASRTGFRAAQIQRNTTSAGDWRTWPEQIPLFVERLRGVVIECRPALDCIDQQDSSDTLFFCDPPYLRSVRSSLIGHGRKDGAYAHEMTDADHAELAAKLHKVRGMAIVCGYPSEFYDRELYPDWERIELDTMADGAKRRTEVLWLNPVATTSRFPLLSQARRREAPNSAPKQPARRHAARADRSCFASVADAPKSPSVP